MPGSNPTPLDLATAVNPTHGFNYVDWRGIVAPAVSALGDCRLYFDSGTNRWRISENGGAFVNVVGGGGGGTLDDAYDFGGAGAGRTINVDVGLPVQLNLALPGKGIAFDEGGGDNAAIFGDGDAVFGASGMFGTEKVRIVGLVRSEGRFDLIGPGTDNVFVGLNAGVALTTGINTVAVGSGALDALTSGNGNTAVGKDALGVATTGSNNTAVGIGALDATTTGSDNTAVGSNALGSNTTGFGNVAVGFEALRDNTTGGDSTAVGNFALAANTTGSANVALGQIALANNTTGSFNTAMGQFSLTANTTGGNNTAVGQGTLAANTTGGNSTAIGREALRSNTTGVNNIAIGLNALFGSTTSGNNAAIGNFSLVSLTTGSSCVGLGNTALNANTTGSNNVGVGAEVLILNTTASGNTAVGKSAMDATTTGGENTAIGFDAGSANTTGVQNTFIGALAGSTSSVGLTNATALGYNTQVTQNNTVILGNGADVGIGTSTPGFKLHVVGAVKIDGKLTVTGALDPTSVLLSDPAAGTALFYESNDGQTAPVSGAATGRIRYNNATGLWQVSTQGGAYVNIATGTTPVNAFIQDGNSFGALATLGTNDAFSLAFETTGVERMRIMTATGRVGIGVTAPDGLLEVNGAIQCANETGAFLTGASIYTSLIIGAPGQGGGLVASSRANPAFSPFTSQSPFDDGLTRQIYYGGGAWDVPDAMEHLFYTAPTYSEVVNTGLLRMTIASTGAIRVAATAPGATGLFQVSGAFGSASIYILDNNAVAGGLRFERGTATARVWSQYIDASGQFVFRDVTAAIDRFILNTVGQFLMVDRGTAAAPAYTFTLDADTGMFSSGANNINLTTAGVLRITVDSTNLTTTLAVLHPLGTAALPSMSFTGDTNTGVFSSGADVLDLSAGGTARFQVNTGFLVMNVPLRGAAGSASAPTYTINGDTDTGMFTSGANTLNFTTAGVERGRFAATGEFLMVSLGTSALPAYSFTGDTNTGMFSTGADVLNFATAGVERGRFAATGEFLMVSLGTSALPAYSFTGDTNTGMFSTGADVLNFATNGIEAARFTSLGVFRMGAGGSAAAPAISVTGDTNTGIAWTAADTLVLSTAGVARLTIDSTGKVTIPGTLDPTDIILSGGGTAHFMQWGNGTTAAVSAAGTGRLRYNDTTKTFQMSADGVAYVDLQTGAGAGGWTDDGANVRLTTAGDTVSVGTATANGKFRVLNTTDIVNLRLDMVAAQTAAPIHVLTSVGATIFSIDPSGDVNCLGNMIVGNAGVTETIRLNATSTGRIIFNSGGAPSIAVGNIGGGTLADFSCDTDNEAKLGTASFRWSDVFGVQVSALTVGSTTPSARLTASAELLLGPGASAAVDVRLQRTGAATLTIDNNAAGGVTIVPAADNVGSIGTGALRWALIRGTTVTSGDLNLEDDAFGTAWTIREAKMKGEDKGALYAIDRVTGKKYKLAMEEVSCDD
jgi:hypothetical protein